MNKETGVITLNEINKENLPISGEIEKNLKDLILKINLVRKECGFLMRVTSGLRSNEKQESLIKQGLSKAVKSRHLTGQAVDIYDPVSSLWLWCLNHMPFLIDTGFWLEDKKHTPTWVHFQTVAPLSGRRVFSP